MMTARAAPDEPAVGRSHVPADLHAHTTASDGALTPTALVERAAARGVDVLAVTDHDTVAGVDEALAAGTRLGVRVIPGAELSVRIPTGRLHLLAYFADTPSDALRARLDALAAGRRDRARGIVERLAELGVDLSWERVLARAPGSVGRPHIAAEIAAAGHAADTKDAFERYLSDDGPAYIPSDGMEPEEAVELVRAAGGVSSLAHPYTLRLDPAPLDALVGRLARSGLRGIEVHRPEQDGETRRHYCDLAERHGLIATGGSDFHHPAGPFDLGDTGTPPLPDRIPTLLLAHCAMR